MKLLYLSVILGLAAAYPAEYAVTLENAELAMGQIKHFLLSDEGIETARNYIDALDVRHPLVFMVKEFVQSQESETLKDLLKELLSGVPEVDSLDGVDIHHVLHEFGIFMRSEDGLKASIQYYKDLETTHPIVSRLRTMVISADEADLRDIVDAILPEVFLSAPGDVKAELRTLFREIRALITTPEGIKVVHEYARALEPTHPALFLVKAFIQSADESALREILDEIFRNFDYAAYYQSVGQRLESLLLRVREILKTDEGFAALKSYILNMESDHPIVNRVIAFISQASDDTLREILDALFGDVFYL